MDNLPLNFKELDVKLLYIYNKAIFAFDLTIYSYNLFWQTNEQSEQNVYTIIFNYLLSMNEHDIKKLWLKVY